jgi:hypothetical protein
MNTSSPAAPAAPDAIARLEARVRWLTALGAFLSVGFVALIAWQFAPRPLEIEANRFVLRDGQWRRRAELGFRSDGAPSLGFYDGEGHTRVSLSLPDDGAGAVRLSDRSGRDRARFGLRADGSPLMVLADDDGAASVTAAADSAGRPEIALRQNGKMVWRTP